jgi:hypothetical protein
VTHEAALAHADALGKRGHRQIGREVFGDPRMQFAEAVVGALHRQHRAELRLPARPLQEHDEFARGVECDRAPEVLLDERKREIDAGRHAGRRPQRAVADEDRIGLDAHVRIARGEFVATRPVRDGAPPVEQAGLRQQERTGAYGRDASRVLRLPAHPAHRARIPRRRMHALAAGDDHRIRPSGRAQRIGHHDEPGGRLHRPAIGRHDARRIGRRLPALLRELVDRREHLQRPAHIEQLRTRGTRGRRSNGERHAWRLA